MRSLSRVIHVEASGTPRQNLPSGPLSRPAPLPWRLFQEEWAISLLRHNGFPINRMAQGTLGSQALKRNRAMLRSIRVTWGIDCMPTIHLTAMNQRSIFILRLPCSTSRSMGLRPGRAGMRGPSFCSKFIVSRGRGSSGSRPTVLIHCIKDSSRMATRCPPQQPRLQKDQDKLGSRISCSCT